MRRFSLLLALLAACSAGDDPYEPSYGLSESCDTGNYRAPGPGCTLPDLPAFTVDGNMEEWRDERLTPFGGCWTCMDGDVALVQAARQGRDWLVFRFSMQNMPLTDGSARYAVYFRQTGKVADDPTNQFVTILISGDDALVYMNDVSVEGLPIESAFGTDGLEVRLSTGILAYDGEAYIDTATWIRDGDRFRLQGASRFGFMACWDEQKTENGCSFL